MTANDLDLLRQFTRDQSQDAFTALVNRHVKLVYSAALRQVRSPQLAEDVSQSVFADLARDAGKLSGTGFQPVHFLTAWLYQVARRTAIDVIRKESRRQLREQIAVEMNNMNATANDWTQIEPLLDDAMDALDETDRSAILLRYFENKTLREVGEALGTSDDAAQKRVSRAVEQLREFFSKRNVTIGAGGLAVLISANAVQAAPIGLAATILAAAILAGTAVHTSTIIAATKTIAMTTLQKTLITVTVAVLAGAGIYEAKQAHDARNAVAKLQAEQTPMAIEIARLQAEANKLSDLLAGAKDQKQLTQAQFNELLKLRGQMGVKQATAEVVNDPAFQQAQIWLAKEKKIREQFELHPEQKIPEMQFLKEEDWLDHARHANVDTANGMRIALSNIRASASGIFAEKFRWALQAYMAANQQQLPATASQLAGYFNPPLQDTDVIFSRYVVPAASDSFFAMNPSMTNVVFVQDKSTVVDAIDQLVAFGPRYTYWIPPLEPTQMNSVLPPELEAVGKAYSDANGQGFISPVDLKPYATTPEQKAALDKLIKSLNPTR
jgi:RNA polymerase sigma factor (sigma-70 family)